MILFDDLRSTLAETLRSRVLVVFGRAVDVVNVGVEDDLARGDLVVRGFPQPEAQRLIRGMQFPQLIRSASVESDGTIEFRLDRGAVAVAMFLAPPLLPPELSPSLSNEQLAVLREASGWAGAILAKRTSREIAADRLLIGEPMSDHWWAIFRGFFDLPQTSPELSAVLTGLMRAFTALVGSESEPPAGEELVQSVAAEVVRAVLNNFGMQR